MACGGRADPEAHGSVGYNPARANRGYFPVVLAAPGWLGVVLGWQNT